MMFRCLQDNHGNKVVEQAFRRQAFLENEIVQLYTSGRLRHYRRL